MKRLVEEPDMRKSVREELRKNQVGDGYKDFKDRICYKYLVSIDATDFDSLAKEIGMIPGNSSP